MSARLALGLLSLVAGGVLALLFPDAHLFWFTGRPLGIALVALGALDLAEAASRRHRPGAEDDH